MTRHYSKRKELENEMSSYFCPKIRKKLARNAEFANVCYALPAGVGVFQVLVKDY
jgi:antitoxin component HigA of HigAB toxin-antitoxin module